MEDGTMCDLNVDLEERIIKEVTYGKYKLPTACKPSDIELWTYFNWYILIEEGNRALLFSKDIIDWECYDFSHKLPASEHPWGKSYIRSYLNRELFDMFTDEEKTAVLPINRYHDYMFLLTVDEIEKYVPLDLRPADLFFADYSGKKTLVWTERGRYWTNTVSEETYSMCAVWKDGALFETHMDADEIGIRPAMWIDIRKAEEICEKNYTKMYKYWS
jgi:hypothetical protein